MDEGDVHFPVLPGGHLLILCAGSRDSLTPGIHLVVFWSVPESWVDLSRRKISSGVSTVQAGAYCFAGVTLPA